MFQVVGHVQARLASRAAGDCRPIPRTRLSHPCSPRWSRFCPGPEQTAAYRQQPRWATVARRAQKGSRRAACGCCRSVVDDRLLRGREVTRNAVIFAACQQTESSKQQVLIPPSYCLCVNIQCVLPKAADFCTKRCTIFTTAILLSSAHLTANG